MNAEKIINNIIKPEVDLMNLKFIKSTYHIKDGDVFIKFEYNVLNSKFNIISVISWIQFQVRRYNIKNNLKTLHFAAWDDTKEFDFQNSDYSFFLYFLMHEYEFDQKIIDNLSNFIV